MRLALVLFAAWIFSVSLNSLTLTELGNWPKFKFRIDDGRSAQPEVYGKKLFVKGVFSETLAVFDITQPDDPKPIGGCSKEWQCDLLSTAKAEGQVMPTSQPGSQWFTPNNTVAAAATLDQYAYVVTKDEFLLRIYDVSKLLPVLKGSLLDTNSVDIRSRIGPIVVAAGFGYIASDLGFLTVVDVRDPTAPQVVNTFPLTGYPLDVEIAGKYAFVSGLTTLQVLDISEPRNPERVASWGSVATDLGVREYYPGTWRLKRVDDLLYLGCTDGLYMIDVSAPRSPRRIGVYRDWRRYIVDVALEGNLASVVSPTTPAGGLLLIDISDPTAPVALGEERTYGYYDRVALSRNIAMVAEGYLVGTIDIRNPTKPQFINVQRQILDSHGYTKSIVLTNNRAFIGTFPGLQIVDMADPFNPHLLGVYTNGPATNVTTRMATDIALVNDLAFLAVEETGLVVLDVANPSNPTVLAQVATLGEPQSVKVVGDMVYFVDGTAGLRIFKMDGVPLPRPRLTISAVDGQITLKWAEEFHGWTLQRSFDSGPLRWEDITGSEQSTAFSVVAQRNVELFRLSKPGTSE
jgi:hypothetical protein